MRKLLAAVFILFLLAVAYWADTDTMPAMFRAIYLVPNGDRISHAVLYGILAYLINLALAGRRVKVGSFSITLGSLLAASAALLEELSQFFFAARTPDVIDLLCGWAGIAIADWLYRRRREAPETAPD